MGNSGCLTYGCTSLLFSIYLHPGRSARTTDNHGLHRSTACGLFSAKQLYSPCPVNPTVIRLSRGHLLPASRPAGHCQRSTKTALPPTLDETEVPTALRGINRRLNSNAQLMPTCRMHCVAPTNACLRALDLTLPTETCLNARSLLRLETGDCHPRGRSPR